MIRDLSRALMLDAEFYAEIADRPEMMRRSAIVVVVATLLSGIGSAMATGSSVVAGAAAGVVTGVIGWFVWSAVSNFIGTRFFNGDSDYPEMLRVVGFAYAPLAFGVIPFLGFVGAVWALFAAVIAVREGLECSTQRSVVTMVFGWAAWLAFAVAMNVVIGWDLLPALHLNALP